MTPVLPPASAAERRYRVYQYHSWTCWTFGIDWVQMPFNDNSFSFHLGPWTICLVVFGKHDEDAPW